MRNLKLLHNMQGINLFSKSRIWQSPSGPQWLNAKTLFL